LNKGLHECEPILVKLVTKAFTVYKTLYYNYIIYFSCDIHHVLTWPHEKNGGVSKYEMFPDMVFYFSKCPEEVEGQICWAMCHPYYIWTVRKGLTSFHLPKNEFTFSSAKVAKHITWCLWVGSNFLFEPCFE
jgi:hypothetical protein